MSVEVRLQAAAVALSGWLLSLLIGWVAGGAVHLLLVAAFFIFPWRAWRANTNRDQEPVFADESPSGASVTSDGVASASQDAERR